MEEMQELVNKLNYHTKLYDEGHPEISDREWDDMYFRLVAMENKTGIYLKDSPTQKISYGVLNKLEKVEHSHPMLSLDKTKSIDEVKSFMGNKDCIAMSKMDGLTCSLTYRGGRLVGAETRGNGIIGEDVLNNAIVVKSIPNKIDYQNELVVDGEIICTYHDFEQFADTYKNPRNFASGSIRLLDNQECEKRNLTFVAWDVITGFSDNEFLATRLIELKKLGFKTVPAARVNDVENCIEQIKEISKELGYPIDGVVFKYDKVEEYQAAGRTDHHFKGRNCVQVLR